jgi:hypothetical protein
MILFLSLQSIRELKIQIGTSVQRIVNAVI